MQPDIKAQWVAALRSGEYKQGRGSLRSHDNEYCCLGVLCDLAVKAGVIEPARLLSGRLYGYGDAGEGAYLPCEVQVWADLGYSPLAGGSSLSSLNDKGAAFEKIADLIEQHL